MNERQALERMDLTHRRAKAAAARLLAARDPFMPVPETPDELMSLVEQMAKTPRKYGVYLPKHDRTALALWHKFLRVTRRPDASPVPVSDHVVGGAVSVLGDGGTAGLDPDQGPDPDRDAPRLVVDP